LPPRRLAGGAKNPICSTTECHGVPHAKGGALALYGLSPLNSASACKDVPFPHQVPWGEHMQKLVTIYLDNAAYGSPKVTGCYADKHGHVEEHLQKYLAEGWQVRSLHGLRGSSGLCCQGWVAVVLEK